MGVHCALFVTFSVTVRGLLATPLALSYVYAVAVIVNCPVAGVQVLKSSPSLPAIA